MLILESAERLLRHYGYTKTTVADIAREAKVGVGTVYLEFPSKEAIVAALSESHHAEVLGSMRKAAQGRRRYADRLAAVLDSRITCFLRLADGGQHATELVHCVCPSVQQAHRRFEAEEAGLLAALLAEGDREGELDVRDPPAVAAALLLAYRCFSPPWLFEQPRDEVERMLPVLHDLVLMGLVRHR